MAESRRPWWKRKRWWAAAALWLVLPVLYVLTEGPVGYCVARGWIPVGVWSAAYGPGWKLAIGCGGPPDAFVRYHFRWVDRGRADAASN